MKKLLVVLLTLALAVALALPMAAPAMAATDPGLVGLWQFDGAGNAIAASTSNDNTVTYDITLLTVTINRAARQDDPTNTSPINFTVVFSEPVTDFATGDLTLSGTAGAITAVVTGSGTTYNVAVSGMTQPGTVTVSIAAGGAHNAAGNGNTASTSTDNTVYYDIERLNVTINPASGQADPTNTSPINFTVVFSEPVTDFVTGDVTLGDENAGATTAVVTGSGTTYNVAVSGMTYNGRVSAYIGAGKAHDAAGNTNYASTSSNNDNFVTYDATLPTITLNQAAGQADPTSALPINFTVVFSEPVTDFATGDVTVSGTAGAITAVVTGSGANYNVAVSGMTSNGTVIVNIDAGKAHDAAGNANYASTSSDNTVTYYTPPNVTIDQAAGQADPTADHYIYFDVVFSEPVTDFATGDVTLSGTAGATTAVVTGSGTTYNVAVSGMTSNGTVLPSIAAGKAHGAYGNGNIASTSTDNSVTYNAPLTLNQAAGQADPTNTSPINFTVVFSEPVTDFATGDVTVSGTAGAITAVVTGSGANYNVAVSGMTSSGTVIASIAEGAAHDGAGNVIAASTSNDNTVTYDITLPTVTINQAAGQDDPTIGYFLYFDVVFSEPITGFDSGDVILSGTAGATTVSVSQRTNYVVVVSGMTQPGTVTVSIAAGGAHDAAGNGNTASTSTDNTVNYDIEPLNVTINQATWQEDPTTDYYLYFQVVFSEFVTDFATGDVTLDGTAGATTAKVVMGSGRNYNVMVSGMTSNGTVIARIDGGKAHDAAGNANYASTSSDNTVTFNNSYSINASAGSGGTITPSGNVTVNSGDNQTFTIADGPGYHIADVQVDGATVGAVATYTFSNVTAGHTIAASFAINTYTLTYTAGANGSISGTASQTVSYGGSGTAVTAQPNTGYHFVSWSDGSTANPRTDSNVTGDISVSASFAINTFAIAPSAGSGGTITPPGVITVNSGDNQIFTIAAGPGYHIVDVQVDGATVGAVATYTFSNVSAGHTIAVSFASNYGFNGLLPPYVAPPKTFKLGSSIPLKWQYTNSAGTVVDSAAANPTVDINRVGDGGSAETPITLDDPGSSGLRYDSLTMTWQFNWKTKDLVAGIYNIRVVNGQTGLNGPFLIQLR